jgi:hypothetical protein
MLQQNKLRTPSYSLLVRRRVFDERWTPSLHNVPDRDLPLDASLPSTVGDGMSDGEREIDIPGMGDCDQSNRDDKLNARDRARESSPNRDEELGESGDSRRAELRVNVDDLDLSMRAWRNEDHGEVMLVDGRRWFFEGRCVNRYDLYALPYTSAIWDHTMQVNGCPSRQDPRH